MRDQATNGRIGARPCQIIGIDNGAIVKRGCAEIRVRGGRSGEILNRMLSLLSESPLTMDELLTQFAAADHPAVRKLAEHLTRKDILFSEGGAASTEKPETRLDVFAWHFGKTGEALSEEIRAKHIAVFGVNAITRQLTAALGAAGMSNYALVDVPALRNLDYFGEDGRFADARWNGERTGPQPLPEWRENGGASKHDCVIAACDFGSRFALEEWNEACVKSEIPYFPVLLKDMVGWIGPLTIPGETACLRCARLRENSHLTDAAEKRAVEESLDAETAVFGFFPSMASILGDIAAVELVKYFASIPVWRAGSMIEVNLAATRMARHTVLKIPRCPVCSPLIPMSPMTTQKSLFMPGNPQESERAAGR